MSNQKNSDVRHILASTFAPDEGEGGHSHVILEISRKDILVILQAMKCATEFDRDFKNDEHDRASLTTHPLGGEHVLQHLTEDLEDWLGERGDPCGEIPRLLPHDVRWVAEDAIADCAVGENYWGSRALRYKCLDEQVHAEIEDKYTADSYLWTRDLWPLIQALAGDFNCEGFALPDPDVNLNK